MNLHEKVELSKLTIQYAVDKYPRVFTACSFGKDSRVLVDLAVGRGLGEFPRLAVGGGGGGAALCAGGQAAVDAVAVGVVGNDENAFFRLRGRRAEQQGEGDGGKEGSHRERLRFLDPDRFQQNKNHVREMLRPR